MDSNGFKILLIFLTNLLILGTRDLLDTANSIDKC
ncbi:hypothetical protein NIES3585_42020 [Nodularia sp. NIES-3585]|nr:hypothetical protein NIES3585_42020 [Nodularia sp. NIES-3585]